MDAALGLPVLVGLIAVALLFDFLNGLHDAANSIATIVSTRVLRPQFAVAWAAFFNFIAFMVFGLHVAQTIGTGIIDPAVVDAQVIFAALVGAIVWNLVTWGLGIPSSSSHALIGGLVGGGMAKAVAWMYPFLADKKRWPKPPDVMYYDDWPVRQPSLVFAGLALDHAEYLELWQKLNPDPTVEEVLRNFPVRQPVLWF